MKFSYTPFIVIPALILLCSLSFWQLQRGLNKQTLLKTNLHQSQLPILHNADIVDILKNPTAYTKRIIKLTGSFQNDRTILLDNKIFNKQVGYEVITPFLISPTQSILINRGWIPMGASRKNLPELAPIVTDNTPLIIQGQITTPHHNRFIKNQLESTHFPLRIQEINFKLLQPLFETQLNPLLITLSGDSLFSFEAIAEKSTWLNPDKHFAYALQWLLLAFSLVIIYTRVYLLNKKTKRPPYDASSRNSKS